MKKIHPPGLTRLQHTRAHVVLLFAASAALAQAAGATDAPAVPNPAQQQDTNAAASGDAGAGAGANSSDTESLRRQLELEEARIRALEQRLAADEAARAQAQTQTQAQANAPAQGQSPASAASAAPFTAPNTLVGSVGPSGYTLQSADGANVIHFRGNLSVDGRYYSDAYTAQTDDTWLIRKLRPTLEGTLDNNFDFRFMPDFGQGKTILQDAWADARIAPWLVFEFGKFKAPVGLERLQLEQYARFIEASLPSDLLPYRDIGAKIGGNIGRGVINYDVGLFDGTTDGGSTDSNSVPDFNSTGRFALDARLFLAPFLKSGIEALKKLGVGIAETYVKDAGTATPTTTTSLLAAYKTPGQQSMFSYRSDSLSSTSAYNNATIAHGMERRLAPQLNYYYRSVGLMSEYVRENQGVQRQLTAVSTRTADLTNTAWQVQGYWFITGEDEGYDTAMPRHIFGHDGFGALELAARYHEIHFDPQAFTQGANSFASSTAAPLSAHAIGTEVNWYLNTNFKVQLDYEVTHFTWGDSRGPLLIDRPAERVLTGQFALVF